MIKSNLPEILVRHSLIHKQMAFAYRKVSQAFNLPETALWLIYCLKDVGECTQSYLCERMSQPKQSINTALKKLEKEGYVTIQPNGTNRKTKYVQLTAKGEEFAHKTTDQIVEAEKIAFSYLSDEEVEMYLQLYERHAKALLLEMDKIINQENH